ncbi:lipoyl synthase [Desulfovibrio inopinatus]|uniref:lipoyl synthase n=1 Tax=Desulfovibrio inopinatus TaxID=102109 RepID=UPI0006864F70|nr:lipoyl synthase [Desulfovibrio inopinatus]
MKRPDWLRIKTVGSRDGSCVTQLLGEQYTVCAEACCPNQYECYSAGTATFLLLGPRCTRTCGFCAVGKQLPAPVDLTEPQRVSEIVQRMDLKYCVLTMVTRDDLDDGGASHVIDTIEAVREMCPGTVVEVLLSDLNGNWPALERVLNAKPEVFNHNVETVPRLYKQVRPQARFERSLEVLHRAASRPGQIVKSGMMVGLGETTAETVKTIRDIRNTGCHVLTLGQYLQPSAKHIPVKRYITEEEFNSFKELSIKIGFTDAACGSFVRSSYKADRLFHKASTSC